MAAGAGAWLLAGAGRLSDLSAAEASLARPAPSVRDPSRRAAASLGQLAAAPLFTLESQAAPKEVSLALQGLARADGKGSALVSIDGARAVWLKVGETSGAVHLVQVTAAGAVIETPTGRQTLVLGHAATPNAPADANAASPAAAKGASAAAQAEAQIKSIFGRNLYSPPVPDRP